MACPRCGQEAQDAPSCPRCGVVFAKLQARASAGPGPGMAPPQPVRPPKTDDLPGSDDAPARSAAARLALPLLLVGLTTVGFLGMGLLPPDLPRALGRARPDGPVPPRGSGTAPTAAPLQRLTPDPLLADLTSLPPAPAGLSAADQAQAVALTEALNARQPMSAAQASAALLLLSRFPADEGLVLLAEAVLVNAAEAERRARRYPSATLLLSRALLVKPGSRPARLVLLNVRLEAGNWAEAEAVARELLIATPADPAVLRGLGLALMRQDENREAAEILQASLAVEDDPAAREMLAHVQKGMRDERGMSEKQLAHFNVRYAGAEHEDVGREILRALDRHYATLTTVFDHEPGAPIPVILFTQEAYYDAAGAPRWSGGVFNHFDGRIRIPIGGLGSSLDPEMDHVLVHEVSHAFIADISRGVAPRDVQEGMAQYMEGKRITSALGQDHLRALADGRIRGVDGFYLQALAFVEHLMGQRGQGGINDLIRTMGKTGNVDEAFRQVYGEDHAQSTRAFWERFRRQHGS